MTEVAIMTVTLIVCLGVLGMWLTFWCRDKLSFSTNKDSVSPHSEDNSAILLDKILITIAFVGELLFNGGIVSPLLSSLFRLHLTPIQGSLVGYYARRGDYDQPVELIDSFVALYIISSIQVITQTLVLLAGWKLKPNGRRYDKWV